jgi:hypothetical protein
MPECSEAQFLEDLCAFHRERLGKKAASPDSFPDAILNGTRLDLYNLYREVTSRGGFRCGLLSKLLLFEQSWFCST